MLLDGLLYLIYPARCFGCGELLSGSIRDFCPRCRTAMLADPVSACPRCGLTIGPFTSVENGCSHCRNRSLPFSSILRLGPYEGVRRELILRMKHATGEMVAEAVGEILGVELAPRLRSAQATAVIPIPLHWRRRLQRGYNQSEVLAHALACRLGVPLRPRWLRRIRNTPHQTGQSAAARQENVRGAFRASGGRHLRGQTILLVDDVLTTGSTCIEAASVLRAAGAKGVVLTVVAQVVS
jgi:ComF family protein